MGNRKLTYVIWKNNVEYTSDSNGYWIHRNWDDLLDGNHNKIQILTHPIWWANNEHEPAENICKHLNERRINIWSEYSDSLKRFKRKNKMDLKYADKYFFPFGLLQNYHLG